MRPHRPSPPNRRAASLPHTSAASLPHASAASLPHTHEPPTSHTHTHTCTRSGGREAADRRGRLPCLHFRDRRRGRRPARERRRTGGGLRGGDEEESAGEGDGVAEGRLGGDEDRRGAGWERAGGAVEGAVPAAVVGRVGVRVGVADRDIPHHYVVVGGLGLAAVGDGAAPRADRVAEAAQRRRGAGSIRGGGQGEDAAPYCVGAGPARVEALNLRFSYPSAAIQSKL